MNFGKYLPNEKRIAIEGKGKEGLGALKNIEQSLNLIRFGELLLKLYYLSNFVIYFYFLLTNGTFAKRLWNFRLVNATCYTKFYRWPSFVCSVCSFVSYEILQDV